MNDRFKFRVWFENLKKYTDKMYLRQDGMVAWNGTSLPAMMGEYIIEQCTGLFDKNGKLIYEGDIVKIPEDWETYGFMSGEKREVYFCDGGFRLKPKDTKLGRGHWLEQTSALEIIGNIHEQEKQGNK